MRRYGPIRVAVFRGRHRRPHTGRPVNVIAQADRGAVLVGAEGQRPRRGGWYIAVLLSVAPALRWARRLPGRAAGALIVGATVGAQRLLARLQGRGPR